MAVKYDRDEILGLGKTDIRWFMGSAFNIIDKDSKLVPWVFNRVQNDYWPKIKPRDIILKARKMGFSMIRLGRMVAKCQTMENRRCVIVSHEGEATKRLLDRAHKLLEAVPGNP